MVLPSLKTMFPVDAPESPGSGRSWRRSGCRASESRSIRPEHDSW